MTKHSNIPKRILNLAERFVRGTICGALNIPYNTAFNSEGDLVATSSSAPLIGSKNQQVKVIVGSRGKNASKVSEKMLNRDKRDMSTLDNFHRDEI